MVISLEAISLIGGRVTRAVVYGLLQAEQRGKLVQYWCHGNADSRFHLINSAGLIVDAIDDRTEYKLTVLRTVTAEKSKRNELVNGQNDQMWT